MSSRDRKYRVSNVASFVQQYARRGRSNADPNDRTYDRKVEKLVKRMKPEDLDRLLRGDE